MHLIVDLGNTQCKVSVFKGSDICFQTKDSGVKNINWEPILQEYQPIKGIISDTRGNGFYELISLLPKDFKLLEMDENVMLPITINYATPKTLGKDRIAGAVAANYQFKDFPVLIVDVGTAITIDFISQQGTFEGGIISPGPELRYRSLHEFTGKLPLLEPVPEFEITPKSTKTAIEGGVQNGIVFEINGYIQAYAIKYPNIKVILTGGYSPLFFNKIIESPILDIHLVTRGLNLILDYQDQKK